jgi:GT2 family glycosyltransferase
VTIDSPGGGSTGRLVPKADWRISDAAYTSWIDAVESPALEQLLASPLCARAIDQGPLVSIVLPVFNTPGPLLSQTLESIGKQHYQRWELCLVDDASTAPHVRAVLEHYAGRDPRIRWQRRRENGGISLASNDALAMAAGQYIALVDHDDVLAPQALLLVAMAIVENPRAGLLYSDSDELDPSGRRCNPFFKPDWNYDLLLGQNYFNHLTVYSAALVAAVGGFRQEFDASQDYDLALRAVEHLADDQILHIPHILYHWRVVASSVARSDLARACRVGRLAVAEHLARTGQPGEVVAAQNAVIFNRVKRPVTQPEPPVTVLVYGSEPQQLRAAAMNLPHNTDYPALRVVEVLLPAGAEEASGQLNTRCQAVSSEFMCLLHASAEVGGSDFFSALISHLTRAGVGAVGAKMLATEADLSSGPLMTGIGPRGSGRLHLDACCAGATLDSKGYFARLCLDQCASVLHGAALAMRTADFKAVGGISAGLSHPLLVGADICLKLGQRGQPLIWTPYAQVNCPPQMLATGSGLIIHSAELALFEQLWHQQLSPDPFYNPNLDTQNGCYVLPGDE